MKALSPGDLFRKIGVQQTGRVSWHDKVPHTGPGVYIVSITDPSTIEIEELPESERDHWNPGVGIIYIGRTKHLSRRLMEFYRHLHGQRSPHRGGEAILLLKCNKVVDWAPSDDYANLEHRLLEEFVAVVGRRPFGNRMRSARMAGGAI